MRDTTHIRFDRDIRRAPASAFVYALIAIGAAFVKQSLAVSSRRKVHTRHPPVSQQARSSCGARAHWIASCPSSSRTRPADESSTVDRITPPEAAKSMDETR